MAEQTSHSRTLNYALDDKILDRVKGAATATAKVDRQELTGKVEAIDEATGQITTMGAAIETGRQRTESMIELGAQWEEALSNTDWGTPEAMGRYKSGLLDKQEAYIHAVKTGDKAEQERLLQELNKGATDLENIKNSTTRMKEGYQEHGHFEDTSILPIEDQEFLAAAGKNTKIDFVDINGTTYSQFDNTDNHLKRTANMSDGEITTYIGDLLDRTDDLRTIEGLPDIFQKQLTGNRVADAEIIKRYMAQAPASFSAKWRKGDIRIKRNVSPEGMNSLANRAEKPTALIGEIQTTLQQIQEGASSDKPTYFDPVEVKNKWASGFTKDDQRIMMSTDVGFGGVFKEDFMKASVLDMPIPIMMFDGQHVVDKDGSGTLEYDELPHQLMHDHDNDPTTPLVLLDKHKELIIEEMMKPENFDLAKDHWSAWAAMKSAQRHNIGVVQRFTQATGQGGQPGARTPVNMPELVGASMYGDGYYDPSLAEGDDRFDAQISVSSSMDAYNIKLDDVENVIER
jgi:hypothetical protein